MNILVEFENFKNCLNDFKIIYANDICMYFSSSYNAICDFSNKIGSYIGCYNNNLFLNLEYIISGEDLLDLIGPVVSSNFDEKKLYVIDKNSYSEVKMDALILTIDDNLYIFENKLKGILKRLKISYFFRLPGTGRQSKKKQNFWV